MQALINETNHIGNNINQIAKNSNAGLYSESDKELLQAYLRRLLIYTERIIDSLVNYKDPKH